MTARPIYFAAVTEKLGLGVFLLQQGLSFSSAY
jgi:hypothetical protein